jgi:hypothetical protein
MFVEEHRILDLATGLSRPRDCVPYSQFGAVVAWSNEWGTLLDQQ